MVATYFPALYPADTIIPDGYESFGIDNLFGALCGIYAIVGGAVGSGIICKDKKLTSKSSLMQAFLAFSITGFPISVIVALYNYNWLCILGGELFEYGE